MNRTGIVIDTRYLQHLTPAGHPECPERIAALYACIESSQRTNLLRIQPRPALRDEIALIHTDAYIERVARSALQEETVFDADTVASGESYGTALLAAGGFMALLDAVCTRVIDNGFAFVRPPGHHAEADRAMGFCFFNNIAIGARYLQRARGIGRILIIDWDVHHGNGTQQSFYDDDSVLFMSLHRSPFYPGSGTCAETGAGAGAGYTVNIPLPAGTGAAGYGAAFERIIEPIARQFEPEFILVSAGFDCHERDPLGGMRLHEADFASMTRILMGIASDFADGRIALVLEGGYDSTALTGSATAVIDELGKPPRAGTASEWGPMPAIVLPVAAVHRRYWRLDTR